MTSLKGWLGFWPGDSHIANGLKPVPGPYCRTSAAARGGYTVHTYCSSPENPARLFTLSNKFLMSGKRNFMLAKFFVK